MVKGDTILFLPVEEKAVYTWQFTTYAVGDSEMTKEASSTKKSEFETLLGWPANTLKKPLLYSWHPYSRFTRSILTELNSEATLLLAGSMKEFFHAFGRSYVAFTEKVRETLPEPVCIINLGNEWTRTPIGADCPNILLVNHPRICHRLPIDFWSKKNAFRTVERIDSLKEALSYEKTLGVADNGIVTSDNLGEFANCLFWLKYKPHKKEFVCHIFRDEILFAEEIVLRKKDPFGEPIDPSKVDFRVRSKENGFIRKEVPLSEVPKDVKKQALLCIKSLKLDFGEVKVLWNKSEDLGYVTKVNTLPCLEFTPKGGSFYAKRFKEVTEAWINS